MLKKVAKYSAIAAVFLGLAGASAYLTLTWIVKGQDTVVVPNLAGKDVVYALEILSGIGLNMKVSEFEYSPDVPKNHVIRQKTPPGAEIKKDRDLLIVLSKGSKTVPMPNLTGFSLQKANLLLEQNGVVLGNVSRVDDDTTNAGRIIAQFPSPMTLLERDAPVDLLVSTGRRPESFRMLDLAGKSLEDALLMIERSGFIVGDIRTVSEPTHRIDRILAQSPPAGYRIETGGRVDLVVNRRPGEKQTARLSDAGGVRLFRYRVPPGFLKRRVTLRMTSYGRTIDALDEYLPAGEEIWWLIPYNVQATLVLYVDNEIVETRVFGPLDNS